MRILLVEDDKNLNTTLCIRLKQQWSYVKI